MGNRKNCTSTKKIEEDLQNLGVSLKSKSNNRNKKESVIPLYSEKHYEEVYSVIQGQLSGLEYGFATESQWITKLKKDVYLSSIKIKWSQHKKVENISMWLASIISIMLGACSFCTKTPDWMIIIDAIVLVVMGFFLFLYEIRFVFKRSKSIDIYLEAIDYFKSQNAAGVIFSEMPQIKAVEEDTAQADAQNQ